ncbi:HAMP domain-containing sensor histidine kinase [Paenibacillus sp. J2TS4]|uniref:sensor histidine kinase n=1 Tax=Paenibacillus sp. J2TS4 TaxID=2807194 RepID=UPI001AFF4BA1|nr:HAMP domain-containing sensor histidine kinase [Paenibacillus sp. J2TS4]GIP35188.1 hypothetical protein J2TS4_43980 [Paenibacillus sp. J2TS4]
MLYFTLSFVLIAVLLTYRKLNSSSTRWLYGILFGWILAFISLVLYLSKFNFYYNVIHRFFDFSPGTWNYLVLNSLNPDLLIRLLNIGVLMFPYCLLGFAVTFTSRRRTFRPAVYQWTALALLLIQVVYYDPGFQDWLQNWMYGGARDLDWSGTLVFALDEGFHWINRLFIAAAFIVLAYDYVTYPKIRFLRNYSLFHLLSLLPVSLIYLLLFSWAPRVLVRATVIPGYTNYLQPHIRASGLLFNWFPYIVFLAFAFMIYIIYTYNSIETYRRNRDIQINKSIDTATLGVRAFTHALKNHLLAIHSEAEYLKEKHADDEETVYSLELMLSSCRTAMDNIHSAAGRLRNIQLNLQPTSLHEPVLSAVSRFRQQYPDIQVNVSAAPELPSAYIDSQQMDETIYNLLINAAESMVERNREGRIVIHLEQQNRWGIISLTDNGPGMDEELLERIFTPFFTTKASVNNWGIGLSYCHRIVEGHDGKITAESRKGEGTTFKIILPIL